MTTTYHWDATVNMFQPEITGTLTTTHLSYLQPLTPKPIQSPDYTSASNLGPDNYGPCQPSTVGGQWPVSVLEPVSDWCRDATPSCPTGQLKLYDVTEGGLQFDKTTGPAVTDCPNCHKGILNYNYCVINFPVGFCYKCFCDKRSEVICAEPDFPGTMGNIKMSVSVYVSLSAQEKILDISKVGWAIDTKNKDKTKARAGKVQVNFTSNFSSNFLLTSQGATDIKEWLKQMTKLSESTNNDSILPPTLREYLNRSVVFTAIYTDFSNQLYHRYENPNDRPSPVKSLYDPNDITWWENIVANTQQYVNDMVDALVSDATTNTHIKAVLNQGSFTLGFSPKDGTQVTSLISKPVIHVPMPSRKTDQTYTLTFTIPYQDYQTAKKGGLAGYCTELMNSILRDDLVLYDGEAGKRDGPVLQGNGDDAVVIGVSLPLGVTGTSVQGDWDKGTVSFPSLPNKDIDYTFDYILGVRFTLEVKKWSPMLLLYFLNTGNGWAFSEPACNQIPGDTQNIVPSQCLDFETDKQKYVNLQTYCQTHMSFGDRTQAFDTPQISQQLVVASSPQCACTNGNIAPYNERDTDAGKKANLCFNSICRDSPYRKDLINQLLGGEAACSQYCAVVYDWLHKGDNMQHADQIAPDLFQKICGDFKPVHPPYDKSVAIAGGIITVLAAVLAAIVSKVKNFKGATTSILILGVILVLAGLTAYLSWEFSAQDFIAGPQGGPYHKICKSRKLNLTLPSEFCPQDLGSECMFNEDCKTKNCNAGCIAQVCTPGENQQRKPVETKEKYFPVTWSVLALVVAILLPLIVIQGLRLTRVGLINKWYIAGSFALSLVLCFIPILIVSMIGKNTTRYPPTCTAKPYHNYTCDPSTQKCVLSPEGTDKDSCINSDCDKQVVIKTVAIDPNSYGFTTVVEHASLGGKYLNKVRGLCSPSAVTASDGNRMPLYGLIVTLPNDTSTPKIVGGVTLFTTGPRPISETPDAYVFPTFLKHPFIINLDISLKDSKHSASLTLKRDPTSAQENHDDVYKWVLANPTQDVPEILRSPGEFVVKFSYKSDTQEFCKCGPIKDNLTSDQATMLGRKANDGWAADDATVKEIKTACNSITNCIQPTIWNINDVPDDQNLCSYAQKSGSGTCEPTPSCVSRSCHNCDGKKDMTECEKEVGSCVWRDTGIIGKSASFHYDNARLKWGKATDKSPTYYYPCCASTNDDLLCNLVEDSK